MTDYSWRCTCPIDGQCTSGASVPDYGELPGPLPPLLNDQERDELKRWIIARGGQP